MNPNTRRERRRSCVCSKAETTVRHWHQLYQNWQDRLDRIEARLALIQIRGHRINVSSDDLNAAIGALAPPWPPLLAAIKRNFAIIAKHPADTQQRCCGHGQHSIRSQGFVGWSDQGNNPRLCSATGCTPPADANLRRSILLRWMAQPLRLRITNTI